MAKALVRRSPYALGPRIQELDGIVRRQQAEIEGLRTTLSLTASGGGWWHEGDISLKLAKLLRVLRLKYVKPNSVLERMVQGVSLAADVFLERERARLTPQAKGTSGPDRKPLSVLTELLNLSDPYLDWTLRIQPELDRRTPRMDSGPGPLISIVLPVYKVTPRILKATLDSLLAQAYPHWEACIAFADPDGAASLALLKRYARRDPRFKLKLLDQNFGISGNSNEALSLARGDYIGLLDHDDELTPLALSRVAAAIQTNPKADFLYTDKELLSESGAQHFSPLLKPGWSPETLYSVNYLTHFNVLRADLMAAIGGWALGVDGAQDWDLFLRATEQATSIVRVPGIAYSWRVHRASTASGLEAKPYALDAQLRSLSRHAERIGLPGSFRHHSETGFAITWRDAPPCRVVILGSTDTESLLDLIVHLDRERRDFTQVDLLLTPTAAWRFLSAWRSRHGAWPRWCEVHRILGHDPVATCLGLLAKAREPVTVFLDGGMLVHTPGALRQLGGWLYDDSPIAFASGLTVENDDRVIEAGCVLDDAGVAHPLFRDAPLRRWGVLGGPLWQRNVDTASPYILALRTGETVEALRKLPGMDWQRAFQHVCVTLAAQREQGRGVVDPSARAIIAPGLAFDAPVQAMIGCSSPYLHPFLTITPKLGITFNHELVDAA